MDITLGPNGFVGRVLVSGKKYQEDHRIYAPGAMTTCSDQPTLLFYQHQLAAGISGEKRRSTWGFSRGPHRANVVDRGFIAGEIAAQ